jgi:HlyD family secretion protein
VKNWKKIAIGVGIGVAVIALVGFTVYQSRKNVVAVQTGKAVRGNLASTVSASGEIKPKTFANIGANAFGKIVHLDVKEGDHVKRGQVLAQLDNVQSEADVAATRAQLDGAHTDAAAAAAAYNTGLAQYEKAKADAERAKLDYDRAEGLFNAKLISKADYDTKRATWQVADAAVTQAKAQIAQYKAQHDSSERNIKRIQATLTRMDDLLSKTIVTAPFDGVVTNLPVRQGETVVVGIQNQPGSTMMTLADMSVITTEVKVDETDIVNVRLGQPAEVSIDAIPKKTFKGTVTEIGNNALVRSTGMATSQTLSSSQEAKDFKVVITLQNPPENLRPGLSATAKITTATRDKALKIPIQALTIRQRSDLEQKPKPSMSVAQAAAPPADKDKDKEEIQGVFVIRNGKAEFVPVETGITGTADIEVTSGLKENDVIVTGSYKVLRTLRNGASVKIDNSVPKEEEKS